MRLQGGLDRHRFGGWTPNHCGLYRDLDPATEALLTRLLGSASALVGVYASPGTPVAVVEQSTILVASYLWDQPAAARGAGFATAWISSGASSIVEPWRIRRAGVLSGEVPDTVPQVSGLDRADILAAALALIATWARAGNTDAIPSPKLINASGGRASEPYSGTTLPGPAVAMRLGWEQTRSPLPIAFVRASNHPIDGAAAGNTDGLGIPPFPPALNTDQSLYLHIWLAGDPTIGGLTISDYTVGNVSDLFPRVGALGVQGSAGVLYVSSDRLYPLGNSSVLSIRIPGESIAGKDFVAAAIAAHAALPNVHHVPPGG